MAFKVQENAVFISKFSKISLPSDGGNRTLPPLASLPRFGSLLTNPDKSWQIPGCTTITGIAKGHKPPCPPLIRIKQIQ